MKSKVILVTGASSGIGKDVAHALIDKGHIVYGVARRVEKMKDLEEKGGFTFGMDVTDQEQIDAGIQRIIDEQGRIDVLFNNAGYGLHGAIEDIELERAKKLFDVNLFGLAAVTKAVLPHMREAGQGRIVNNGSIGGVIFTPLAAWYHASKYALEGWTDCLRLETKDLNIEVVLIQPGAIQTEFSDITTKDLLENASPPYRALTEIVARNFEVAFHSNFFSSPPEVITEIIVEAIETKKPKTRYIGGKWAKFLYNVRRTTTDRIYEKVLMLQFIF